MKGHIIAAAALAAASFAVAAPQAKAGEHFAANYSGFNELGALNAETGAILSNGTAHLDLDLDERAQTLKFTLTFANLGTTVTQAHIHFGKRHVPGGVIVFFCATPPTPSPAGTQSCGGGTSGTVTGTITAGNVIGPAAQNVPAGSFDGLADAIESGTAYGNIHTTQFPAGEIRGEIRRFADIVIPDNDQ
jgi:CHRD domain